MPTENSVYFPLCLNQTTPGPDGCQHIMLTDIMPYLTILYIIYVTLHSSTVRLIYLLQRQKIITTFNPLDVWVEEEIFGRNEMYNNVYPFYKE